MFESHLNEKERRIEWMLLLALFGLMLFGAAFVYSASSSNEAVRHLPLYKQDYFKQVVFYALGLGLAAGICVFDYRQLARWSLVGYWIAIFLLVAVFFVGTRKFGAQRWINLGLFQFQPSEFAKLAFIFFMAAYLSRPVDELKNPGVFFRALGFMALPFVLILKEPDLGSALVLIPIGIVMMFVAGVPARFLKRLLGGAGLLVVVLLVNVLYASPQWRLPLEEYQRDRLLVFFNQDFASPQATPAERQRARERQRKKTYNVEQALITVGSGGLTGKGWRQGTQNSLGYLPRAVAHNDFIFSVIAEEKGFVGSVTVLGLYTVVLLCGIRIASQARDRLGKLLAVGVVTMLFSHVFINIGMNIRLMPVTGIPLPLLSYGGTSVLCSLVAAGLLQNISIHRRS
jgi:rod shape determining protein RodA